MINILVFSEHETEKEESGNDVNQVKYVHVSKVYNVIMITRAYFSTLVTLEEQTQSTSFMRACGAQTTFMVFSKLWTRYKVKAMSTIGPDEKAWHELLGPLPYQIRRKWSHLASIDLLTDDVITAVIIGGNDISRHSLSAPSNDTPLISVFTSTFRTGAAKFQRAARTMIYQTYNNWEWVIVDDSDSDKMTKLLQHVAECDLRVRYYKFEHSGFIGEAKRRAAGLCTSEWLVELDHDDGLFADLLKQIVEIRKVSPDAGVIYSDYVRMGVDEKEEVYPRYYPTPTAFGLGGYFSQYLGQWHAVYQTASINHVTARSIVGMPNHVRSFSKSLYHAVGGFNHDLNVADDYDLMLRLWLSGAQCVRIAAPMYFQLEKLTNQDNFTVARNDAIQHIQGQIARHYWPAVASMIERLENAVSQDVSSVPAEGGGVQLMRMTKAPEAVNTGSWMLPDHAYPRYEYTWLNGQLYAPPGNIHSATAEDLRRLVQSVDDDKTCQYRISLPAHLIRSKQLSVVLLVGERTRRKTLMGFLNGLAVINKHLPVYVVGHPKSVLRTLMLEPATDADAYAILLRQFKIWSFGVDSANCMDSSKWIDEPKSVTRAIMANYALKIGVRTSHVIYFDTYEHKIPGLSVPDVISHMERVVLDTKGAESSADTQGPALGRVCFTPDFAVDATVLSGFIHPTELCNLYGYWSVEEEHVSRQSPAGMIGHWCAYNDMATSRVKNNVE